MDKETIINYISPEIYTIECEDARWAAPETGLPSATKFYSSDTPHTINSLIWLRQNNLNNTEKIKLLFSVYEDMPCYTLLMYNSNRYYEFTEKEKWLFLVEIKRILSYGDPILSGPLEYFIVIDLFENCLDCNYIWQIILGDAPNSHIIRSILRSSATAPWQLKSTLYRKLIDNVEWHQLIYESLIQSYYSTYGYIDKTEASFYLSKLSSIPITKEYVKFKKALNEGDRYTNYAGLKFQ